jgi:Fe-S-cluster containining protein
VASRLEELYKFIDEQTQAAYQWNTFLPCSAGCSWCCERSLFLVSATEAIAILETIESWGKHRAREVKERARSELSRFHQRAGYGKWTELVTRHTKTKVVCPLLVNGVCTVYSVRPVPCRTYGVSGYKEEGKHVYGCPKVEAALYDYLQTHDTVELVDFAAIEAEMEGVLRSPLKPLIAWVGEE